MKSWAPVATLLILIGALAVFAVPKAEGVAISGYFTDDNGNLFEADIDAIAAAGITKGCNPPANSHYCPTDTVDRGAMAAFLRRALNLPSTNTNYFTDDNNSIFEADINAIAAAGITKGCNPPTNNHYCPRNAVDRAVMAAFLQRALGLPEPILEIPVGRHNAFVCTKDGERCSLTVDLTAGRTYRVQEGVFQATPASSSEMSQFNASNTSFRMTIDGSNVSLGELSQLSGGGVVSRRWRREVSFPAGTHTLVGTWRWNGTVIQTNTLTIRASG
jgi:hypothetical protein